MCVVFGVGVWVSMHSIWAGPHAAPALGVPVNVDGIAAANERRRGEWLRAVQRARTPAGGLSEFGQFLVQKDLMARARGVCCHVSGSCACWLSLMVAGAARAVCSDVLVPGRRTVRGYTPQHFVVVVGNNRGHPHPPFGRAQIRWGGWLYGWRKMGLWNLYIEVGSARAWLSSGLCAAS